MAGIGKTNATYRTLRLKIPLDNRSGRGLSDVMNEFFAYNPQMTLREVHADVRYNNRYAGSNALFTIFYSVPTGTRYFAEEFFGDKNSPASQKAQTFLDNNPSFMAVKVIDVSSPNLSFSDQQHLLIFYLDQSSVYEADWGLVKTVVPSSASGPIAPNEGATMGDIVDPDRPDVWVWNLGEVNWPAGAPFLAFKNEDRLGEYAGVPPCCYGDRGSQGPFSLVDRGGIPGDFGSGYTTFLTTTFTATTTSPVLPNLRDSSNKPSSFSSTTTTPPPSKAWQFGVNPGSAYIQDFELLNIGFGGISVGTFSGERAFQVTGPAGDAKMLIKKGRIYGDFDVTLRVRQDHDFLLIMSFVDKSDFFVYKHGGVETGDSSSGIYKITGTDSLQLFNGLGGLDGSATYRNFRYRLNGTRLIITADDTEVLFDDIVPILDRPGRLGVRVFESTGTFSEIKINPSQSGDCCRRTTYVCVPRLNKENVPVPTWKLAAVECVPNDECVSGNTCDGGEAYTFEETDACICGEEVVREGLPAPPASCTPVCNSECYEITSFNIDTDHADCTITTGNVSNALTAALGFDYRGAPEAIVDRVLRGVIVPVSCNIAGINCIFDANYQYPSQAFTQPTMIQEIFNASGDIVVAVGFSERQRGISTGDCPVDFQQYRSMVITVTLQATGTCDE